MDCRRETRSGPGSGPNKKKRQLHSENVTQTQEELPEKRREGKENKENNIVGSIEHYNISKEFGLIAAEIEIKKQNGEYTQVTAMIDTEACVSLIEK